MNLIKKSNEILLSSTDCFFLALERHSRHPGAAGSVCRYVLELDGTLAIAELRHRLEQCNALTYLLTRDIVRYHWLGIPRWTKSKSGHQLVIREHVSEELLPRQVLDSGLDFDKGERIVFDVIHQANNRSVLVVSWHHLLMDGQGAILLLRHINQLLQDEKFIPRAASKMKYSPRLYARTIKLFLHYTALFWTPYAHKFRSGIEANNKIKQLHQKIKFIAFDREETLRIQSNGIALGANLGLSPFLLACTAISVMQLLQSKGKNIREFWIPIPQDQRKKGAGGPILGNQLSFLFYTLKKRDFDNVSTLTASIQKQMVDQVKKEKPKAYDGLMRGFRMLPSGLYYHLVKGSRGTSLASFLFTTAADHPTDLQEFMGHSVRRAISLPPNTYPPGFTIAFMKNDKNLQAALMYYEEIWNEQDVQLMENQIKNALLQTEPIENDSL